MNAYLVILRHSMDDFPLYLTADRADAFRFAREEATWDAPKHGPDASTPVCIDVVEFANGKPTSYGETVRVWEDEGATAAA